MKTVRFVILSALSIWGMASIILACAGEREGIIYTVAGGASLIACYFIGKLLYRKGLLPDIKE